ncbi:MAG: GTPase HflX [candidate division WOR-3 bacterium]
MKSSCIIVGTFSKNESEDRINKTILEMKDLSLSLNMVSKEDVIQKIEKINPAFYIGKGKVDEIHQMVEKLKVDSVIFSNELSPLQKRNLEKYLNVNVIDRTELILRIFERNAKTTISKLESELAKWIYMLPRLTGKGISMSQTGGGIGTRGPGEKKLEVEKRYIEKRIEILKNKIKEYQKSVKVKSEKRKNLFKVTLFGYTNAGKTTIMNRLTRNRFYTDDKLFTTLDTVTRKLERFIVVTDTVGFLGDLPHEIIESFKLTIEEASDSDLKLFVVDISDQFIDLVLEDMAEVIEQLKLNRGEIVYVFNKIDLLLNYNRINYYSDVYKNSIFISAKTGDNFEMLKKVIFEKFYNSLDYFEISCDDEMLEKILKYVNRFGIIVEMKSDLKNNIKFYIPKRYSKFIRTNFL